VPNNKSEGRFLKVEVEKDETAFNLFFLFQSRAWAAELFTIVMNTMPL